MNKVNRVKVFAVIALFIALLLSGVVYASSGEGTKDNPFVIDLNGSYGTNQTIEYKEFPFYFRVTTPGAYEIDVEYQAHKVTFLLVDNDVNKIRVLLPKEVYNYTWNGEQFHPYQQMGVTNIEGDDNLVANSLYSIKEYPVSKTNNKIMTNDLYNVVVNSGFTASRGNLYFFTNKVDTGFVDLFNAVSSKFINNSFDDPSYTDRPNNWTTNVTMQYKDDLIYEFSGVNNTALNDSDVAGKWSPEAIITRLLIGIGDNFILGGLKLLFGDNLSINTIIFNQLEATKLDLYGESLTPINQAIKDALGKWYTVFLSFAYIAYIIILVYIGIMMISSSGTPRQGKAKAYFTNWVTGLIILVFFPAFGFKLIFQINNSLVSYISKDASEMNSFFNVLESYKDRGYKDAVWGGDSFTTFIEQLEEELGQSKQSAESLEATIKDNLDKIKDDLLKKNVPNASETEKKAVNEIVDELYSSYKLIRGTEAHNAAMVKLQERWVNFARSGVLSGRLSNFVKETSVSNILGNDFESLYDEEIKIAQLTSDLRILKGDVLALMRIYAGKYQRLVFGALYIMLLFQLLAMVIIYLKRLLVITILIAVFPIVMIFYCIDKMADGTAQTLSLWFKEFLANVFIASVHAVIYMTIIEMGIDVFENDNGNWLILVIGMLLLVPAESLLKEVFGLNAGSLGKLGGMAMKVATGIGAARMMQGAMRGKNDKSILNREKKFNDNMARKQLRADNKAEARNLDRKRNDLLDDSDPRKAKNTAKYDKADKKYEEGNRRREKRMLRHDRMSYVKNAGRVLRNAGAVTIGTAYGIASGGTPEDFMQGAAITGALSGKQGDADKNLRKEVKDAYDRRHPKT